MSKGSKLGVAAVVAGVAWWRRWRPFLVAVEGDSMSPTLHPGDWLIALARATPKPRSLVVVEHPLRAGLQMVKRIDHFEPDGEVWLLGDDADRSTDSRSLGPFSERRIRGVVVARYRPRPRIFRARIG